MSLILWESHSFVRKSSELWGSKVLDKQANCFNFSSVLNALDMFSISSIGLVFDEIFETIYKCP